MIGELTNHLWQSTLFAGTAGLLTVALRRNQAKVRFWLWFAASIKFLLPLSLLMNLGSYLDWMPATREGTTGIATPSVAAAMLQVTRPFPETILVLPSQQVRQDWTTIAVLSLWAFGAAAIALIRLRDYRRIRWTLRSSTPVDLQTPFEIRSAPGPLEPGVVGLLHPVLLLPEGIEEHLTPPQLDAILAHELCHIRRHDNLSAAIHMLVEATFWFHPLVWWIGAKLLKERERACDEYVLSQGGDPRIYADGILKVCKLYLESPLVCVSGVTGATLKPRIEAIMTNRSMLELSFAKKSTLAAAALAAIVVPIALGVVNSPLIRAQSNVPKYQTASIRPCTAEPDQKLGAGYSLSPGRLNTGCLPLAGIDSTGLIQRAYARFADGQPHPHGIVPITGGPDWLRSELFEIDARAEGNPEEAMMQGPMLQALLEDRFGLKTHRETRAVPVYELTLAQASSALMPFEEGSCIPMPMKFPLPAPPANQPYCKVRVGIQPPTVDAQGSTLTEFAQLLDVVLDRPVVDKTGLTGKFDIHLEFAIDAATPRYLPGGDLAKFAQTPSDHSAQPIFAAIRQLGLRLEPAQGAREFLVIEHVERPTQP